MATVQKKPTRKKRRFRFAPKKSRKSSSTQTRRPTSAQKRPSTAQRKVSNGQRKPSAQRRPNGKRRVKRNYTRLRRMIIGLVVVVVLLNIFVFKRTSLALWRKGYSKDDRAFLLELSKEEIKEYLSLDEKIDLSTWNEYSNNQHYYDYVLYKRSNASVEDMTVVKNIDRLYESYDELERLGYTKKYCRDHYGDFKITDFEVFSANQIDYDSAKKFMKVEGCIIEDIPEYVNSGASPTKAIMKVSYPFVDSTFETEDQFEIQDPEAMDVLVKNAFILPESYIPDDLVDVEIPLIPDCEYKQLRKEAAYALEDMVTDAEEEDLHLVLVNGYISYKDQDDEYSTYLNTYGYWYANTYSVYPGASEHQLGMSFDLTSQNVLDGDEFTFNDADESKWVEKNAHKYGFILRYPKGEEEKTGSENDPWHFRYVGVDIATEIYENEWTLEDYIMLHGFDYSLKYIAQEDEDTD